MLLDVEPIRPGQEEAQAALRLLGRIRRLYGARFVDLVTIDSWYVQGPFLKAVEKLGWEWIVVLKQERMEVLQEARALSADRKPDLEFDDKTRGRHVKLWEVKDLNFSKSYGRTVRVVHSQQEWVEHKVVGGKKTSQPQTSHWWWMASEGLQGYPVQVMSVDHLAELLGHWSLGLSFRAFLSTLLA